MKKFSQKDKAWGAVNLGTSDYTLASAGCAVTCLAMLSGRRPDEVNEKLKEWGGFAEGCLVKWDKAALILDLPYNGNRSQAKFYPVIAETNYYKNSGYPQHFFLMLSPDTIVDPLDGKEKANFYPIVGYRNVGLSVSQEQESSQGEQAMQSDSDFRDQVYNFVRAYYKTFLHEPTEEEVTGHVNRIMAYNPRKYAISEWLRERPEDLEFQLRWLKSEQTNPEMQRLAAEVAELTEATSKKDKEISTLSETVLKLNGENETLKKQLESAGSAQQSPQPTEPESLISRIIRFVFGKFFKQ